ncbi:MAG: hypothetical protein ONB51_06180 [candidate division KSB1 bacterium]|nr:hypothetical protein [candidate division KSB1 bacterium]MDZ7408814.1 hypothetical protein [candidate division KSB1 bacterium]
MKMQHGHLVCRQLETCAAAFLWQILMLWRSCLMRTKQGTFLELTARWPARFFHAPPTGWLDVAIKSAFLAEGIKLGTEFKWQEKACRQTRRVRDVFLTMGMPSHMKIKTIFETQIGVDHCR